MENNIINEAIHIEFYGLPGCGKSTISHKVAEQLRYGGFNIIEPSYDILYGNSKFVRLLKKIMYSLMLFFKNKKIYKILKELVEKNEYKGLEIYRQLANLAYKIYIYNYSQKAIYIWDEGIVQSAISLSSFNNIDPINNYKRLIKMVNNEKTTIKLIRIDVPIELSIKRLNERENKHSRVEKVSKEYASKILNRVEKCVYKFDIKDGLYTDKRDDELVKCVYNYIESIIKTMEE